jgi:hypothetical protein
VANWQPLPEWTVDLARVRHDAGAALERGDLDGAERLCKRILGQAAADFDALQWLGLINLQRRHVTEALHLLEAALRVNPASADVLSNFGLALQAAKRHDEAIASYRRALQLVPGHPEILCNLGNACLELGRLDEALASYDEVLKSRADHVGCLVNRGNVRLKLNQPEAALANYDAALAAMPCHPQILTNRGHALRRLDRPAEALADLAAAMAAAPDFAEAHFEAAMAHLALGDFASGWKQYEWRWKTGAFAWRRRSFRASPWVDDQPVAGKTILLHAEQGFGDTIQFIRYAPLLVRQGANVICEVQPPLLALLSGLEGITFVAAGAPLPVFDLHCPLMSLPLAFGTQPATVPDAAPYLQVPRERQRYWQARLPSAARPRVGLVWSGSPTHHNDRNRSIPLARLARLITETDVTWISLQTEVRASDAETLRTLPGLVQLGGELRDFADTAAVIADLDAVVSVDTSVAHLAGALGQRTMILLPHAADFRWMRSCGDSAWYPTATLLRQCAFGDWDSVIERLREEIAVLASGNSERAA